MKTSSLTIALTFLATALASAGDFYSSKAPVAAPAKAPIVDPGPCLTYDYIDLEYGIGDYDSPLLDNGDRWGLSFSKSLGEIFFLTGGYTNAGADYLLNNSYRAFESHGYNFGLGAHFSLSDCIDFTIEGGGDHHDNRFRANPQLNYDTWSYYVGPGIRARAGRFEGYAKAFYIGREGVLGLYGTDVDGWVFKPGVLFHLTDHFALKVAGDIGEQGNSAVTFGARIHF